MKDCLSARGRLLRKILKRGGHRGGHRFRNSEILFSPPSLSLSLSLSLSHPDFMRQSTASNAHQCLTIVEPRIGSREGIVAKMAEVGRHVSQVQMDASPRRVSLSRALPRPGLLS